MQALYLLFASDPLKTQKTRDSSDCILILHILGITLLLPWQLEATDVRTGLGSYRC
jgi:hypothetical protein